MSRNTQELERWNQRFSAEEYVFRTRPNAFLTAQQDKLRAGMVLALKPGGLLILQGYRPPQLAYATGGPKLVENLYTEELLRSSFSSLQILQLASHDAVLDEGAGHSGMSALIDLVARK